MPAAATALAKLFAPTGTLRAAINLGNPILARRGATPTDAPSGVSVDLAQAFAKQLGLPLQLIPFAKAAESVAAVRGGAADIGFFAVDPARSDGLLFTAPYVLIEGSYLVPQASALQDNAEVDQTGTRVAVGSGSAYDLFLTRALQQAQIERLQDAPAVLAALQSGQVEVAAGIRQLLQGWADADRSLRMLPGRFMVIEQAMGLPADRGAPAQALLAAFVEQTKASGAVAEALARHGIAGAAVAPAA